MFPDCAGGVTLWLPFLLRIFSKWRAAPRPFPDKPPAPLRRPLPRPAQTRGVYPPLSIKLRISAIFSRTFARGIYAFL